MMEVTGSPAMVDIDDVGSALSDLVAQVEGEPARPIAVLRERTTAAVLLHPTTFFALLDATQAAVDVEEAEATLEDEPLESFSDYHTERLARRRLHSATG